MNRIFQKSKAAKIEYHVRNFLSEHCFEILVFALLFHLYGSVFFNDIYFYGTFMRFVNTVLMFLASLNSFYHKNGEDHTITGNIIVTIFFLNLILTFLTGTTYNQIKDISYLWFLFLTLFNIAEFLISPHRLDKALISAAFAGYLLIIEIAVRIFLILYDAKSDVVLEGIDFSYHTNTYIDTVYYCTGTITSIGFGDILPISYTAKMLSSILGLIGQFYLVVIMSLMINKFLSANKNKKAPKWPHTK